MDLQNRFPWITFYERIADNLLRFKDNREKLVAAIHRIPEQSGVSLPLKDQFLDRTEGPLKDICPFTTIALFNRSQNPADRTKIAAELAKFLQIKIEPPDSFTSIPTANNLKTWFFSYHKDRQPDDINTLWQIFEQAIYFSESEDSPDTRDTFVEAYDKASQVKGVGWNLTMGFYWIRPRTFTPLDKNSGNYIEQSLDIHIGLNGIDKRCSGNDYLTLIDELNEKFREESCPAHSFPELSWKAYHEPSSTAPEKTSPKSQKPVTPPPQPPPPQVRETTSSYSIDNILAEGCFLEREKLETILQRLRDKKNLILQGPPGTGKTWLAKKLAFALIGKRDEDKIRPVQFHPNLSYEDFVRGWRPSDEGKLDLIDGPFLQMINTAKDDPDPESKYAIIIEEINRGNPAQIFGEMLTLLESDKRNETEALELSYEKREGKRVYIPENLYVIGTMNVADRSIAMVDFALRRRFAFVDLEPIFGSTWRDWVHDECKIDEEFLSQVEERMNELNKQIAEDSNLGAQFKIGHSYVTPLAGRTISDPNEWFKQVVETEIGPLLDEYWFDTPDTAQKAREQLLEGL